MVTENDTKIKNALMNYFLLTYDRDQPQSKPLVKCCNPVHSMKWTTKISSKLWDVSLFKRNRYRIFFIFKIEDTVLPQKDIDSMVSWTLNSLSLFHPNKCFTIHISSKLNETILNASIDWSKKITPAETTLI